MARVKFILRYGADINTVCKYLGISSLFCAVYGGHPQVLEALLLSGRAEVNIKGGFEDTPLHWAVYERNIPCLKMLLEHGADINAENSIGRTPDYYAQSDEVRTIFADFMSRPTS